MSVTSIRERLLRAVLAALHPVADRLGATLHRSPAIAIIREQSPALVVFPENESITERVNDRVSRELTLRVTALVRVVPPEEPQAPLDQLVTAAHAALMRDPNFGGLALGLKEVESEWDAEDADATAAVIHARYCLTYRTLLNDISISG
jgi:hypothetical protein